MIYLGWKVVPFLFPSLRNRLDQFQVCKLWFAKEIPRLWNKSLKAMSKAFSLLFCPRITKPLFGGRVTDSFVNGRQCEQMVGWLLGWCPGSWQFFHSILQLGSSKTSKASAQTSTQNFRLLAKEFEQRSLVWTENNSEPRCKRKIVNSPSSGQAFSWQIPLIENCVSCRIVLHPLLWMLCR